MSQSTAVRKARPTSTSKFVESLVPLNEQNSIKGKGNTTPAGQTTPSKFSLPELRAMAWQAIGKHAGAIATETRDMAPAGIRQDVRVHFVYEVDGKKGAESFDLDLSIDSDTVSASSSLNVSAAELMAYLLAKFNASTRTAVLANLVDTWKASGESLPTDATILAECEETLKKVRKANEVRKRGAVKSRLKGNVAPLAIVG